MKFGQVSEAKAYAFVNARIKARKGQLLTAADYEQLLSISLFEGLTYLRDKARYLESFSNLDLKSTDFPIKLERILHENIFNEMNILFNDIPKKARKLIRFYFKKYFIDVLKQMIRQIHTKELESYSLEDFYIPTIEDKTELSIISKSESIIDLIQKLQTPWVREALESVISEYEKQENVLLLENAVDQFYYKYLWDHIILSQDKRDRKVTQKIIGIKIDLTNIILILRGKLLNFPPNEILPQLIPINYRLSHNLIQAVKASSFSEAIERLQNTNYSDLIQAIHRDYREKEKSIVKIEQLQQEWYIQTLFTSLAGFPFHIGTFLAYIEFRLQEIENLRIIFETKWKGIDIRFAREQLIYFK
ncbi:MAG: V-type ATPase subunit [Candidatus Heimdallarchaeota archaeon]|nr:MAG: V-type ATPase subunit [Candidatus Heimdallarchaeota archaeon]